ncbi:MAG: MBL fold metallo-hydrolase [Anaerolineales bacterium]|nr:MBL fold metallo-hydrolase [Anaerolineales bacterium]
MAENVPFQRHAITRFETSSGAQIFCIPVQAFPILWGNVYLVLAESPESGAMRVLIDTGSGFGECNAHLEAGLSEIARLTGQDIRLDTLTHVLITHGHIDHFGGLSYVRPRTPARIGVHELDLRNLTNYEERLTVVSRRLQGFLVEAGVGEANRRKLIELYMVNKTLFRSVEIDFTYEASGMRLGPFEFFHVPGHCAGHVVIRLGETLFSGDHVLNHISPHQSPESLTLYTGLGHYLRSLDELQAWAQGVSLTLGGHGAPVERLAGRLDEIRTVHADRLEQVLDMLEKPLTIEEISRALFREVHGYNVLLALEEAGAHVEYLYQRGLLAIHNLEEIERADGPLPTRYRSLRGAVGLGGWAAS